MVREMIEEILTGREAPIVSIETEPVAEVLEVEDFVEPVAAP